MRAHPDEFLPFLPSEVDPENMMSPSASSLSLPLGRRSARRSAVLREEADASLLCLADEFARYCDTVESTAEWGGEPEVRLSLLPVDRRLPLQPGADDPTPRPQIRALSLHYEAPVIVVQAGTEMVEHGSDFPRERAMLISCVLVSLPPGARPSFELTLLILLAAITARCTASARCVSSFLVLVVKVSSRARQAASRSVLQPL